MTDRVEAVLRRALDAEAASVPVSPDALAGIRSRIAARRARRRLGSRGGIMIAIGSGTATALVATAFAVLAGSIGCVPAARHAPPAASGSAPAGPSATGPATGTPAPTGTSPAGGRGESSGHPPAALVANLPVYYVGTVAGAGARLYREYHRLPVGGGTAAERVRAAVAEMLAGGGYDPDYRSPWPEGAAVRAVSVSGGTVTVDLSGARENPVDRDTARMAVAQLVWTVTAASGGYGVLLRCDGATVPSLWGRVPTGTVLTRDIAANVLAPVWLIDPQQGARVGRTFTVHLAGILFEAQGNLRVVAAGGAVVLDRPVQFSKAGPDQGEATLTLTLPPGRYFLVGYDVPEVGGEPRYVDDHEITVS